MHGGEPELMQYREQLKSSFDTFQVCKLVCDVLLVQHWILVFACFSSLSLSLSPPLSLSVEWY